MRMIGEEQFFHSGYAPFLVEICEIMQDRMILSRDRFGRRWNKFAHPSVITVPTLLAEAETSSELEQII